MAINSNKFFVPAAIRRFLATEYAGGVVMIIFAALAIILANSPLSGWYVSFISVPLNLGYGDFAAIEPLKEWVKDILMVFFFLLVGMELKREMREGVLSKRDQIILPLFAAISGMIAPAIIFLIFNHAHPMNLAGWAIPSATDIAFAVCVLTIVGRNIPPAVKIFLLAIAIFDDLGAIVIIALFYNTSLAIIPLALALVGIALLTILNRRNITSIAPYIIVGIYLWFCLYHCGIHTTIAGVAVGMAIPMRNKKRPNHSPLNSFMVLLHPWISFAVLPIFAFTAAGVNLIDVKLADIFKPLSIGIALGLFFGKQIGIFGTIWLMVKLRFARKPQDANWMQLYGVSIIAGIGFTMSLFIGLLAFPNPGIQEMVKIGVIGGSILSIIWAFIILRCFNIKNRLVIYIMKIKFGY